MLNTWADICTTMVQCIICKRKRPTTTLAWCRHTFPLSASFPVEGYLPPPLPTPLHSTYMFTPTPESPSHVQSLSLLQIQHHLSRLNVLNLLLFPLKIFFPLSFLDWQIPTRPSGASFSRNPHYVLTRLF